MSFVFFHSTKKCEVKNMKLENKQLGRSAQSWMSRVERMTPLNVDHNSELRD